MKNIISLILRNVPRKYIQLVSHFGLRAMAVLYAGNNVQCPISGRTYRKFLPYGRTEPRDNALCPDSLSLERHRLIWLYLKEKTDFFTADHKMLHVAPEICFMDRFEKMVNLDYITADLESPLAKVKMDLHSIPFEDDTFDVIFCNHVLEHVEDDIQCMREMYRVMKPGGWGIMQVPMDVSMEKTYEDPTITDPKERERHFRQDDHYRLFGRDYGDRLRSAGFEVTQDDYVRSLSSETIKRYALPAEEDIYFVRKV